MSPERTDDTASELELAKIRARANLLLALYAHVSHDLEQSHSERDSLRGELDRTRAELDQARGKLGRVQGELQHARGELERVHGELSRRDNDLHLSRVELGRSTLLATELQQRLDDILNSTSWRLTAPLRALARLVKSAP
jgi:septal ring factor EnvC (AmiA/AmiB activator)